MLPVLTPFTTGVEIPNFEELFQPKPTKLYEKVHASSLPALHLRNKDVNLQPGAVIPADEDLYHTIATWGDGGGVRQLRFSSSSSLSSSVPLVESSPQASPSRHIREFSSSSPCSTPAAVAPATAQRYWLKLEESLVCPCPGPVRLSYAICLKGF